MDPESVARRERNQAARLLATCYLQEDRPGWAGGGPEAQSGIASLVLNDYLGGEILKTQLGTGWRYYNRIDGLRLDTLSLLFPDCVPYLDERSSREEALAPGSRESYRILARRFSLALVKESLLGPDRDSRFNEFARSLPEFMAGVPGMRSWVLQGEPGDLFFHDAGIESILPAGCQAGHGCLVLRGRIQVSRGGRIEDYLPGQEFSLETGSIHHLRIQARTRFLECRWEPGSGADWKALHAGVKIPFVPACQMDAAFSSIR